LTWNFSVFRFELSLSFIIRERERLLMTVLGRLTPKANKKARKWQGDLRVLKLLSQFSESCFHDVLRFSSYLLLGYKSWREISLPARRAVRVSQEIAVLLAENPPGVAFLYR
jgi:hypothetical protein